jgi:Asp-tRNA(Asn)/Glu-tRNA(Gln) amidotransferase A subunit family amidase
MAAVRERWPDEGEWPALYGVMVGVKDVFRARGLPTRAGSRLPAAAFAGEEAASVQRLREAGAVVLGKTVSTELAYYEPGRTRNPRAAGRTPGGSSSGSAAAVAAGQCPLALGTQTIGSVCRPAAFCGVVGFKPSHERVPRDGVVPLAPSYDHVGVLAASVEWARRAAAVLLDGWRDEAPPAGRRPTLGVPVGPYLEAAEPLARHHLRAVQRRLASAGWPVREVPAMADFAAVAARHHRLVAAEAAAAHGRLLDEHRDILRPRTVDLIERGRRVPAEEAEAAREARFTLRRELEAARGAAGVDLWLSPAAPGPPPAGLATTGDPVMNLPWTQAGLPTVALPAGGTPDGLPLGVQLTARLGADEALLAWAAELAPVLEAR